MTQRPGFTLVELLVVMAIISILAAITFGMFKSSQENTRRRIAEADDPEAERQRLVQEYEAEFYNPYQAASLGFVDDVIDPADTRRVIVRSLEMLQDKADTTPPKKHGNVPL